MNPDEPTNAGLTLSRRHLLSALGTGGLLVAGAGVGLAGSDADYDHYTYARTDGEQLLRVAWYETYDDSDGPERVERSDARLETGNASSWNETAAAGGFRDTPSDGVVVVDIDDVLPGDAGTVVVGLLAETGPLAAGVALDAEPSLENGRREPERAAGDDTSDAGELADALQVSLWHDTGALGVVGACDGRRGVGEAAALARTSLRDGADATPAASEGGVPIAADGPSAAVGCLAAGETTCIGFRWELPEGVGNVVQGDSVSFSLTFGAYDCASGGVK